MVDGDDKWWAGGFALAGCCLIILEAPPHGMIRVAYHIFINENNGGSMKIIMEGQ